MKISDLFVLAGFIFLLTAGWTQYRNKPSWSIFLLVACGICLRIYCSLDPYLHPWDERFHALVAKNIIQHPLIPTLYDNPLLPYDYKNWTACHIWLHKPPLTLWSIALSLRIFGVNAFAVRIPSILLSTLTIPLTYSIGKNLFNRNVGWLAAFFITINGRLLEMSGGRFATDHPDVFFLFFIELGVFFATLQKGNKKWWFVFLVAIGTACAIYSKWLVALIVFPIWLLLIYKEFSKKNLLLQVLIFFGTVAALVLPWQYYIYHTFPNEASWENTFNWNHIFIALDGHSGAWYFYLTEVTQSVNGLIIPAFIVFSWFCFRRKFAAEFTAILIWVILPFGLFSSIETKMPNYIMFCFPAMLIILSFSWWKTFEWIPSLKVLKVMRILLLMAVIGLSFQYSTDRLKLFRVDPDRNKEVATAEIKNLCSRPWIKTPVFFNTDYDIDIMFYTSFVAYSSLPTPVQIIELNSRGYQVVLFDNQNIPGDIRTNPLITLIKL